MREHLPPAERVDLNDAVAHVIQTLQPLAAKAGTTIEFSRLRRSRPSCAATATRWCRCSRTWCRTPSSTASAAAASRSRVAREAAGGGRPARFVVSVTDDGPGIAPQHLPRLTERFYRVNVPASREKGGTGLGLAIVKHILNRHRGELNVTSKVGQGSTFSVALPALAGSRAIKAIYNQYINLS